MKSGLEKQKADPKLKELGIHTDEWRIPYDEVLKDLSFLKVHKKEVYFETVKILTESDFWLFCYIILGLPVNNPYLMARCYDVQDSINMDMLWLWARDHWKSTLITFASNIWDKIKNPTLSTAILSNSAKIARPHFNLIKTTIEQNELLKMIWSHIFYKNPRKERDAKWSDEGLYLKTSRLKEPAFGFYGLIDTMPTGFHFDRRIIDDLVDINNVGTWLMMQKVLEAYKNADNLKRGDNSVEQVIGTRYKFKDLYEHIENMKLHRVSIIAAEVDELGNPKYDGIPVYQSKEALAIKKKKQGNVYWAQNLQTPLQHGSATFKVEWLKFYVNLPEEMYYYILSDPASNPAYSTLNVRKLDYSVMVLLGAGKGRKLYLVDLLRDKISLKDKWEQLKLWHKRYPIMTTGYEEFGNQKDREYFDEKMREEGFYFHITPIKYKRGDGEEKSQRINILTEYFPEGKIVLPKSLMRLTKDRGVTDLIAEFIDDEYSKYPMTDHDDMLDTLSRVADIDIIYPDGDEEIEEVEEYQKPSPLDEETDWQCMWGDL